MKALGLLASAAVTAAALAAPAAASPSVIRVGGPSAPADAKVAITFVTFSHAPSNRRGVPGTLVTAAANRSMPGVRTLAP